MSEINITESGTKGILWFKKDYSKEKELSAESFFEIQRQEVQTNENADSPVGSITQNKKTYNFNDQDSINQSLWSYADKDKSNSLDENEYNTLLAHSISNGIVGKRGNRTDAGLKYSYSDGGFVMATSSYKKITPDYEELAKLLNLYEDIKLEDLDIDLNNDNLLEFDEFENSILTKLLTSEKGKEIINQQPTQEEIELAQSLCPDAIADVHSYVVPQMKYSVKPNGTSGQSLVMTKQTRINADYNTLIETAEKYTNIEK